MRVPVTKAHEDSNEQRPPFSASKAGRERFHNENASGGHAEEALDQMIRMHIAKA